jgi:hypothetical protein
MKNKIINKISLSCSHEMRKIKGCFFRLSISPANNVRFYTWQSLAVSLKPPIISVDPLIQGTHPVFL